MLISESVRLQWLPRQENYEVGYYLDADDLQQIEDLRHAKPFESENVDVLGALKFGVGVHMRGSHPSEQSYLSLVERLFRERKLRFVFATGSPSYGKNMPAQNVVFLGGSTHLSSLVLAQCAGRAGRRGYGDGVGRVFFAGFSDRDIIRRMCMPLDELTAGLPLLTSYILRATVQLGKCLDVDITDLEKKVLNALTRPLFAHLLSADGGSQWQRQRYRRI
jgi:hypothetical protein